MVKKKILVVDDELETLKFLKRRLEKNDFEVSIAKNGEECLKLVSKVRPDIILLDIIMPQLDGYEVIKCLRANPKTQYIPVVMHSVKKGTESIFKSMELGSVDYVTKPTSFQALLEVLKRYV